jgi:uncharacterized protein with FMN-binding domain
MTSTVPGFDRRTVEPGKFGGRPRIRDHRFSAQQLLEHLAAGKTFGDGLALLSEEFVRAQPDRQSVISWWPTSSRSS